MSEKEYAIRPNKTQLKKQLRELNDLGKRLAGMPDAALNKVPLPDDIRRAVADAKRFSRGALQRQLRRIAAMLNQIDIKPIELELQRQKQPSKQQTAEFHQLEQWRDRLIDGDEKLLTDLIDQYPLFDRQLIRQLVRNSQLEKRRESAPKSARKLFKYLSEIKLQTPTDVELDDKTGHTDSA